LPGCSAHPLLPDGSTEGLLKGGQRPIEKRLSFGVTILSHIENGEDVQ